MKNVFLLLFEGARASLLQLACCFGLFNPLGCWLLLLLSTSYSPRYGMWQTCIIMMTK